MNSNKGEENIFIKGARVNNLKNIDVEIPRDKFIVVTGVSGSGKTSLAFDTLYAEGQRRYVESLSSYARQFLGRISKPECDYIIGIPPAIAIEQKVSTRNARSTVGTSTEIYDYLRMLFGRIGHTFSPISGVEVKKHDSEDIVKCMLSYPVGTRFMLMTSLKALQGDEAKGYLIKLMQEGYSRLVIDNNITKIDDVLNYEVIDLNSSYLVIDRMSVSDAKDVISRLVDSSEIAFFESDGECILRFYTNEGEIDHKFSKHFEADGIKFQEPNDIMFNFNSPIGACPTCEGYGMVVGIDENLVIPNKALSIYEDAVMCWRGEKMSEWKRDFILKADKYNFPIHKPYYELTEEQKSLLWHGNDEIWGIDAFFKMVESNLYKVQYRVMLARYRGKTLCPDCKGARLKPEALYIRIGDKNIAELTVMPIVELQKFFDELQLTEHDNAVAKRLLVEIKTRLQFLIDVGLGYLTLNRLSSTLSGGESQRINLATSLGSSLVGSLYILDEPSIGLHSRDTNRLIKVLRQLQSLGNTVVVVEHDEEIIREADYIIDIGPDAGRLGGEVVYQGEMSGLQNNEKSYTVKYLTGVEKIDVPTMRRKWNNFIRVKGAAHNNLKGIDVDFPLNVFTVVTGVSGSGKSTLVRDTFYRAMCRHYNMESDAPGAMLQLLGDVNLMKGIEFVDQNPIGKSTRSNPATYLKAFDEIRRLYADQQAAKQMGFSAGYFSFNSEGGRCEECKGEGVITVEMQFMADITLVCECCNGKRYKSDVLEVEYRGKNISDILDMTINQAVEFFSETNGSYEKKIVKKLKPLQAVGLGYLKMGQSSSTLSGGESQRIKLAAFLSNEALAPTIFIFDEPTTGLHMHDVKRLLKVFDTLVEKGHTVIVIEHNMDVIKCADHIIDLGPEGGDKGGTLVCAGTPEEVTECPDSYTGKYLKEKLN
ncbi:MAG: excinuclease ABC subunit UvrA [Bacteroidales bacterium]|nr:excinuclease ABC subunit UvrA [Bacteroidales bacterium]